MFRGVHNLTLAAVLLLAACAHDNYTIIPAGPGSADKMQADLKDCKHQALHAYFEGRSNVAGLLGPFGAVGGAIGASIDEANTTNNMKLSDINPVVESCMRDKGYSGTSAG